MPAAPDQKRPWYFTGVLGGIPVWLVVCTALAAAVWLVYGQTLDFGFINYDDPVYVSRNSVVQRGLSPAGLWWALTTFEDATWHPLTWASLMADTSLYGPAPWGYHLTNVLLHLAATLLLFRWCLEVTGRVVVAGVVGGLFAVHPLHVESVAWVTERKDLLSAAFFFVTLLAYNRYVRGGTVQRWGWYAASVAAFALALMSKTIIVGGPLVLLALDHWPLGRRSFRGSLVPSDSSGSPSARLGGPIQPWIALAVEKIPFFVCSAGASVLTWCAVVSGHSLHPSAGQPWWHRLVYPLTSYAVYLWRTLVPCRLGPLYDSPLQVWGWWQVCLAAATVAGVSWLVWRRRADRPWELTGWLWYVCALLPVSGIVSYGYQHTPDRYTYLAHVGIFLAAAQGSFEALACAGRPGSAGRSFVWGWSVPLIACVLLSARQATYWRSGVTLFGHAADLGQAPARAAALVANAYVLDQQFGRAERALEKGLRSSPDDPECLSELGYVRLTQRRWVEAAECLLRAVPRMATTGEYQSMHHLGVALSKLGDDQRAKYVFEKCLAVKPDYALAHYHLAMLRWRGGSAEDAKKLLETALRDEAACPEEPPSYELRAALAWLDATEDAPTPAVASANQTAALALATDAVRLTRLHDRLSLAALAAALAASDRWDEATETVRLADILPETGEIDEPLAQLGRRSFRPAYESRRRPLRRWLAKPGLEATEATHAREASERVAARENLLP